MIIDRGQHHIPVAHGLIEQTLYLAGIAARQVELRGTGDLTGDDMTLVAQHVAFLIDAVVDMRNGEKNINQQYRDQGDQQNLVLETEVLHDCIRSSCDCGLLIRQDTNSGFKLDLNNNLKCVAASAAGFWLAGVA